MNNPTPAGTLCLAQRVQLHKEAWFHGPVSRHDAEALLTKVGLCEYSCSELRAELKIEFESFVASSFLNFHLMVTRCSQSARVGSAAILFINVYTIVFLVKWVCCFFNPFFNLEMLVERNNSLSINVQDGDFLVRESQGSPGQYVLTGMQSGIKKHLLLVDPEGVHEHIKSKYYLCDCYALFVAVSHSRSSDQQHLYQRSTFQETNFSRSIIVVFMLKVRTKDRMFESVSHLINYHCQNELPIISAESALVLRRPVHKSRQL
uniref:(California timema) hypothetical protein n=1 Tax=Timema californicum TaxID=61474 RepID=A0A7R9J9H5_TIMCA|nr:unnamed protein product [Timema californicum]